MTRTLKSNSGFGLVETMIAAAVGIAVIYFMSQYMISQAKMVTFLEARLSRNQFATELANVYADEVFCTANFAGKTVKAGNQNVVLNDLNGQVAYDPNDPNKNLIDNRIQVDDILFENPLANPVPAGGSGWVDLSVQLSIPHLKKAMRTVKQRLYVTLDGSQNIVTCNSLGASSGGPGTPCDTFLDGTPNNIKVDPNCSCVAPTGAAYPLGYQPVCSNCQYTQGPFPDGSDKIVIATVSSNGGGNSTVNYQRFRCHDGAWTNITALDGTPAAP